MKKVFYACIAALTMALASCGSDNKYEGDWAKGSEFAGVERISPVTFTLNNRVYVGLGVDDDGKELSDFWSTADGMSWVSAPALPDNIDGTTVYPRFGAVAFVLNGKAYVGMGYRDNASSAPNDTYYNDFYCFDGTTWTKAPEFPTAGRRDAIAFVLKGKAYVGGGIDKSLNTYNDYYSFDGTSWTNVGSIGDSRLGGTAFVINDEAYICLGVTGKNVSTYQIDMVKFDGQKVTRLHSLANVYNASYDDDYNEIPRAYAASFVLERDGQKYAYITSGMSSASTSYQNWEYDYVRDRWKKRERFPNVSITRVSPAFFVLDNKGYMTVGGSSRTTSAGKSTWVFTPGIKETDKNDY